MISKNKGKANPPSPSFRKGGIFGSFEGEGADRADFDTFATLNTSGFGKGCVLVGGDGSLETSSCKSDRSDAHLLCAHPYAFTAEDTFVGIECEDEEAVIDGKVSFEPSESL